MALMGHDWNVVIVGSWNPAILTPAGVAKLLFEVAEGTPVAVEVPMDGVGPHRVRYDGLTVALHGKQLIIGADTADFPNLARAMVVGCKAIKALPVTPLSAAGINLRYRSETIDIDFSKLTKAPLEDIVSDVDFKISHRALQLSLVFDEGYLKLTIQASTEGACEILFNFHRDAVDSLELQGWLTTSIDDLEQVSNRLLEVMRMKTQVEVGNG